jgi:hypothetical protein
MTKLLKDKNIDLGGLDKGTVVKRTTERQIKTLRNRLNIANQN